MPSRAASHWLLSFHPQSLLAVSSVLWHWVILRAAQPMGGLVGGARGAGACARGLEGKQIRSVCSALSRLQQGEALRS